MNDRERSDKITDETTSFKQERSGKIKKVTGDWIATLLLFSARRREMSCATGSFKDTMNR